MFSRSRKPRPQPPWGIILQAAVLLTGLGVTWGATRAEIQAQGKEIAIVRAGCASQSETQANLSWIKSLGEATGRRLEALETRRENK